MHDLAPPLRVAHVLRKLDGTAWGGTETHVAAVTQHFTERGVDGLVMAPYGGQGGEERLATSVQRFHAHCPYVGSAQARAALIANAGNILSFDAPWRLWRD